MEATMTLPQKGALYSGGTRVVKTTRRPAMVAVVEPENAQPISDGAGDDDQEIALADEPSTKKLIAIMGSLWVGVFFAALGMLITLIPTHYQPIYVWIGLISSRTTYTT